MRFSLARLTMSIISAFMLLVTVSRLAAAELPRAKPEDVGLDPAKLAEIARVCQKAVDEGLSSGAVVGIVRRGHIAYLEAFGYRDLRARVPMTTDTLFRIFSMTKPITTVAAMTLWEEGKLGLDDPVEKYVPEFRSAKVWAGRTPKGEMMLVDPLRPMTIRDLMRHTSGLTYGFYGDTEVDQMYMDAKLLDLKSNSRELVRKVSRFPLLYHPGDRWRYSIGVDVLGYIVEQLSGKPLDEFMKERLFGPLDMRDTDFYVPPEKLDRFAVNYGVSYSGKLVPVDEPQKSPLRQRPGLLSGGGGLISTARDYLHFCQMLLNGGELFGHRVLRAETVAQMTKNQLPKHIRHIAIAQPRDGFGFGLGFYVVVKESRWDPAAVVGEYGWAGAASTHFWISPKHELAVVVLQQRMPYTDKLARAIKPIVYDAIRD